MDSDGDGLGDLNGIISKLDYIQNLGFETIWISPFFDSPQGDFGYDISDYYSIEKEYGDTDIVDSLIAEVHRRDMKIVFDLVLNHTSNEHPWFVESAGSKDNDKSDYYIWRDGNGKKPPNNWINVFNKEAWHYVPDRDQYYYTAFLEFQPDLNWRHPEVRAAMFNMVKYWMGKDVDGFRLDIFNCIMEKEGFPDNSFVFKMLPSKEGMKGSFQEKINNINHPDNFSLAKELRDTLDAFPGSSRFLIGEAIGPLESIHPLVGAKGDGLNLIFLFDMIYFDFKAKFFRKRILEFEEHFPSPLMPTIVYGNHDNFRRSRRIKNHLNKDRVLTLFQMTARGVPVVYYGAEIGMMNAQIKKKEALDPISWVFKGLPQFMRNILPVPVNRDVCRTPMQWNSSPNAGFSPPGSSPWLPVGQWDGKRTVEDQQSDPGSLLNTYRDLLKLREDEPSLRLGTLSLLQQEHLPKNLLAFIRDGESGKLLVLINFSNKERSIDLSSLKGNHVLYKLNKADSVEGIQARLSGLGGMVIELKP